MSVGKSGFTSLCLLLLATGTIQAQSGATAETSISGFDQAAATSAAPNSVYRILPAGAGGGAGPRGKSLELDLRVVGVLEPQHVALVRLEPVHHERPAGPGVGCRGGESQLDGVT